VAVKANAKIGDYRLSFFCQANMTFLEGQQGSHVARYSKQPLVSSYSSKVFIWLNLVPERFTLPTSTPDMKVLSTLTMVRNRAILSVDYLCNINNFECSISGMFFRHDHKQTIRNKGKLQFYLNG